MSDTPEKPSHLRLVSNFVAADYIYAFTNNLDHPGNHEERRDALDGLRRAATLARIPDYKLLDEPQGPTIYLRTPNDVLRFKAATSPGDSVQEEFVQAEPDFDVRKLKRIGNKLQDMADRAGFRDTILFGLVRAERLIVLEASSKRAYFAFDDFLKANRDQFAAIYALQRKEPEMDIPFPTPDTAVQKPTIIREDTAPASVEQESDRFIKGSAELETRTPPAGDLTLTKSFTEQNYPFALRPIVTIDPNVSTMDRLCSELPDYAQWKLETKNAEMTRRIRGAMEKAYVDDYCLYEDDMRVHAHFKDPKDLAVAYASIMPDMQYHVDYLHCSENASPLKMSRKVKRLRELFAQTGEDVHVRFVADKQRHVIQAITDTAEDFARVQGISRQLERTNPAFRFLVGM